MELLIWELDRALQRLKMLSNVSATEQDIQEAHRRLEATAQELVTAYRNAQGII